MRIILLTMLLTINAWGWTLERVRLTSAGADQISGVEHRVTFSLVNSGSSMMENLYIDVREIYRTPNCGVANWRKSGCSRPLFTKTERIFPRRGKDYSFNWTVNQDLTNYMVFRFVDKARKKDKAEIIKIFEKNKCRPYSREIDPGLGLVRDFIYIGDNIQSTKYDQAFVNRYEYSDSSNPKEFLVEYYHKGRNSRWINMEGLAGMRAVDPNNSEHLLYTFTKQTPLTLFRYNEIFAIEYNILNGFDRQKMVIRNKRGKALYYEIICEL